MPLSTGPFVPAGVYTQSPIPPWLFPGILPAEGVVVLASAPKAGKTCFATALARAIATGTPFLGQTVEPRPVLYCAYEETMLDRQDLHEGLTAEDPFLIAYPFQLPTLETRPYAAIYRDRARGLFLSDSECPFVFDHAVAVGAKLIVVDSLHAAAGGADLAHNGTARRIMASLCMWSSYFHVTVLVLHHLVKTDRNGSMVRRIADSSQIMAAATASFVLVRDELPDGTFRVVLEGGGRRIANPVRLVLDSTAPLDYRFADAEATLEAARSGLGLPRKSAAERILAFLERCPSATAHTLARELSLNPATVRKALAALCQEGRTLSTTEHRQNTRYTLPDSPLFAEENRQA